MTCLKLMMCWMRMDNQYFNNRSKNSLTSIGDATEKVVSLVSQGVKYAQKCSLIIKYC